MYIFEENLPPAVVFLVFLFLSYSSYLDSRASVPLLERRNVLPLFEGSDYDGHQLRDLEQHRKASCFPDRQRRPQISGKRFPVRRQVKF